jgi:syntaxin 16
MASPMPGTSTPIQNPYNDPALLESETDRSFSQSTLQQTAQQRVYTNDHAIAQREREIEDIAQGIIELSNIFQDLNTMVIDQGSLLDRIDYNVENMASDLKAADRELTVATNYQRRSIKRKIMLLLIIVIAGMIILLSLKLGSKSSTPAPPSTPDQPVPPEPPTQPNSPSFRRASSAQDPTRLYSHSKRDWRRRKRKPFSSVFAGT